MTALTVVSTHNNTEESTTSTSFVNTAVSIPGSSLLNTVKYLVLYTAGFGGSEIGAEPYIQLKFGSIIPGQAHSVGSSSGTPNQTRSNQLCGWYIITGTGSDALQFRKKRIGTGTAYFGGQSIIAIPLDDLAENTDYFQTTQNGDTAVITSTSSSGEEQDLISLTKTTEAADYLVLASCENDVPTGTTSDLGTRLDIDGTNQKIDSRMTASNGARGYIGWSYAKIHTLTAASHTFAIEGFTVNSGISTRSWRRGRIILIRVKSFDQLVSTSDTSVDTVGTNWSTTEVSNSHVYTANQTEDVVVIGNLFAARKQSFRYTLAFLRDNTSGLEWSKYIGFDSRDTNTPEVHPITTIMHENINTSAKTFQVKRTDENNTTHNTVDEDDIIVWSMNFVVVEVTKTFTIDVVLSTDVTEVTKTFTIDVVLQKELTKTFTIDVVIQQPTLTKTFTIDTCLVNQITKTFTIDTVLIKELTKTFTIDTVLIKELTKTFTMDVIIQKELTKTFTIDTVIIKELTKTFTIDTVLVKELTKTFTLDVILVKELTKTFTIDTILVKELTKTFTIDVVITGGVEVTKTFTIDTVLIGEITKTFTIDVVIQQPSLTKTFTIDTILIKELTKTFTIDTVLIKELTKTFTIDVVLSGGVVTKTFTIDTILQKEVTKTFTIDTILQKEFTKTFTIDTILQKEITKTFTIDVVLVKELTKTFTIDVVVSLTAPAIITKTFELFINKLTSTLYIGGLTHTNFLNSKAHRVYLRK